MNWEGNIHQFILLCHQLNVKMILVGGGAVNFHGYQRHSADVDFWISTEPSNLKKLVQVFQKMGYEINDFPDDVKNQEQNVSVKFSPEELNLELITKFLSDISFEEAFKSAEEIELNETPVLRWRVLSYDHLIESKLKSARPKDLLDIQELQRINGANE